jgi:predicted nucleic acid-binding protein
MTTVVYDAGALVAAERNDRRMWAEHRVRLELGLSVVVPAPVVAQVSRSPRQVQLRRLLAGCEVVGFDEASAHAAGRLLASSKTKTNDVVDATVVELAVRRRADIVTGDARDLSRLVSAAGARLRILQI